MWRVIVFCALMGSTLGQSWVTNITDNLRDGLSRVLDSSVVNYSTPVINVSYGARVEFDMRAMGHLYNSSHSIIDIIANKQAYPEGIVWFSDGNLEVAPLQEKWKTLLAHYAGPVAVIVVLVLLVAILPLTGLFWCCCQWCKSGRRRRPFDRKYDACLKGILAIVLIAFLTLFLFGVVSAFATDSQLDTGTTNVAKTVKSSVHDVTEFLNATQAHSRHLLVTNFKELEAELNEMLTSSGQTVLKVLDDFTSATSVQKLNGMVQQLDRVPEDLRTVQKSTSALRSKAEELDAGLRRVKALLHRTLVACQEKECIKLQEKYRLGQLGTEIQYNMIPDVSDLLTNVSSLLESNIKEDVAAGLEVFSGIKKTVDQHIPKVQEAITDTGRRLAGVADEITYAAGNMTKQLAQVNVKTDEIQRDYIERYAPYRKYVSKAAAAVLLLIVVVMSWGLLCGVCGKRPDVYGTSDCCNKGTGSTCLLCGIAITLFLGAFIAIMILIYFVFGVTAQRFVCDPLTEPRDNRLFADVEMFVDFEKVMFNEKSDPDFNITSVLLACHHNKTVYEVLHLNRLYDLDEVKQSVQKKLGVSVSSLRTDYPPRGRPLLILKPAAREKLDQLANTGLSDFNFDKILEALETNITSLPLESLSSQLQQTARSLTGRAGYGEVARSLREAADQLDKLQRDVVNPMLEHTAQLNKTATELRDVLRFNQSSLKEAIQYRIRDTTEVELFLNTQGPDLVQNLTHEFAEVVGARLQEYLSLVAAAAHTKVGRCEPLSNAFNATRDSVCRAVLMPTHGYWISLAWCVLLFVPLMVIAQRLSRLYRHPDPYPGPLVEAEYLYDAYADRDNIPLANAYKAEKRSGRNRREGREGRDVRETREGREGRRGEAESAGVALAPPLDAHHARRYNDMAPKHWEEGLPRYHGPTEYERPPPYYYPGPNDRQ
ncbi:prominin-like protein isoform X1 [Pieris rapae]|uniref:prominin-like protein isoform X1 n=1 Tax=Pieris rapae TaxID=64459 RepID=UPI001E27A474|nr:prominin-like protein isoform X1 [Pieris rapae]